MDQKQNKQTKKNKQVFKSNQIIKDAKMFIQQEKVTINESLKNTMNLNQINSLDSQQLNRPFSDSICLKLEVIEKKINSRQQQQKNQQQKFRIRKKSVQNFSNLVENTPNNKQIQQIVEEKTQQSSENKNKGSSSSSEDQEIQKIIQKYSYTSVQLKQGEIIGKGSSGIVYKGLDQQSGRFIAIKQMILEQKQSSVQNKKELKKIVRELDMLVSLQHEHVIQFYGVQMKGQCFDIIMEYMSEGSVLSMLKQYGRFPEQIILKFVKQVLEGLKYLHSKNIVHSDIKCSNILSDSNGNLKLADFGASKKLMEMEGKSRLQSSQSVKGSLFWMSPEQINNIWSLGCTIIEMATAQHPWPQCKSVADFIFQLMTTKVPPIPQNLSKNCRDFILQCLTFDQHQRPTVQQLCLHSFIQNK